MRSSLAGLAATVLFAVGVAVVVAMFVVVVYLTWRDVIHLLVYVLDRQFYTLDGWDAVPTNPK